MVIAEPGVDSIRFRHGPSASQTEYEFGAACAAGAMHKSAAAAVPATTPISRHRLPRRLRMFRPMFTVAPSVPGIADGEICVPARVPPPDAIGALRAHERILTGGASTRLAVDHHNCRLG